MPKKENSAGKMQNYNPETGRYEGGASGGGESKKENKKLSSFKKQPSAFDKANAKRMGKKSKVEDWQISEALADFEWQITSETTVGQYAQETADRLGIDKEEVLAIMEKEVGKHGEDENLSKIWFGEQIDDEPSEDGDAFKELESIDSLEDLWDFRRKISSMNLDREQSEKLEEAYDKKSKELEDKDPEIQRERQAQHDSFTKTVGKFIDSNGSDQDLDEMVKELRRAFDGDDEAVIKKLAMMFKGTIK